MNWQAILFTGLGGFLGSIMRYGTGEFVKKLVPVSFPYGTLTANILGSLIIGIATAILSKSDFANSNLKFLIITGFCGGFTTFSSFTYENLQLIKTGNYIWAALYISFSLVLGLGAVFLGFSLVSK